MKICDVKIQIEYIFTVYKSIYQTLTNKRILCLSKIFVWHSVRTVLSTVYSHKFLKLSRLKDGGYLLISCYGNKLDSLQTIRLHHKYFSVELVIIWWLLRLISNVRWQRRGINVDTWYASRDSWHLMPFQISYKNQIFHKINTCSYRL